MWLECYFNKMDERLWQVSWINNLDMLDDFLTSLVDHCAYLRQATDRTRSRRCSDESYKVRPGHCGYSERLKCMNLPSMKLRTAKKGYTIETSHRIAYLSTTVSLNSIGHCNNSHRWLLQRMSSNPYPDIIFVIIYIYIFYFFIVGLYYSPVHHNYTLFYYHYFPLQPSSIVDVALSQLDIN